MARHGAVASAERLPARVRRGPLAAWQRWRRTDARSPATSSIVLVVKAIVLTLIWFAFFRAPVAPHMTMEPQRVEQQVAAPRATPEPPHAVR